MSLSNHFPKSPKRIDPDLRLIAGLNFRDRRKLFWLLFGLGVFLRLLFFDTLVPFFPDQDWFYHSAANSVLNGYFPLTGITSSITWLHQGAVWTYMLIPALVISNFHPLSGTLYMLLLSLISLPLYYSAGKKIWNGHVGAISVFIAVFSSFLIINSRIAYHTSPIPVFTLVVLLLLLTRRQFLAGLFLALLYQLHILTVVFWPAALIFSYRGSRSPFPFMSGVFIGLIPFFLSGPIQSFGVFFWLAKFAFGHSGSSGVSAAYQVVFSVPVILGMAYFISKLNKIWMTVGLVGFLLVNMCILIQSRYQTTTQPTLPEVIAGQTETGYPYLQWWKTHNIYSVPDKITP